LLGLILAVALAASGLSAAEPAAPVLYRRVELPAEVLAQATIEGTKLNFAGDLRLCDVNGDGQAELLVFRSTDAGLKPCFLATVSLDGKLLWKLGQGGEMPMRPGPVALYDFDGDGRDEIACFCFVPKIKAAAGSLANVRIQIRNGGTGQLIRQAAPPELTSCKNEELQWTEHHNWNHQRLIVANLRGGDRPRDIVVKVASRVLAFDDRLNLLWKYDLPDVERPFHPAYVPAVGDIDGDGRDEVFVGHVLLGSDGKPLWQQRRTSNSDSVAIAPWDQAGMKAISSGAGEVFDAKGKELVSVGRRMVPHGRELRVADFVEDSPGMEMLIRNEGAKPAAIVVGNRGDVLRRFKLNNSPGDMGMEAVLWNGPDRVAMIYNGGALWNGSGKLHAELHELPVPFGPKEQGWYHCIPADVCGDAREELVLFNPWDRFVWIYTAGEVAADVAYGGYHPGPRQYNARLSD
jgi:hypothetical protein